MGQNIARLPAAQQNFSASHHSTRDPRGSAKPTPFHLFSSSHTSLLAPEAPDTRLFLRCFYYVTPFPASRPLPVLIPVPGTFSPMFWLASFSFLRSSFHVIPSKSGVCVHPSPIPMSISWGGVVPQISSLEVSLPHCVGLTQGSHTRPSKYELWSLSLRFPREESFRHPSDGMAIVTWWPHGQSTEELSDLVPRLLTSPPPSYY